MSLLCRRHCAYLKQNRERHRACPHGDSASVGTLGSKCLGLHEAQAGIDSAGVIDFRKDDIESMNGISMCGKETKCGIFSGKPHSGIGTSRS